jgi:hypothetical protein
MTFANLPYVFCLDEKDEEGKGGRFDIAFLGAGFDTVCSFYFVCVLGSEGCRGLEKGVGEAGWRAWDGYMFFWEFRLSFGNR